MQLRSIIRKELYFILCGCFVILIPASLRGQTLYQGSLNVGDLLPSLESNIYNYPTPTVNLTELKGKVIILDFWATSCSSCIEGMPKMEELQKKYKKDLQIILITKDNHNVVERFKRKASILKNVTLPMIDGDSVYTKLFPYSIIPQHVWINKIGKISEITNGYNATEKNIDSFLNNSSIHFARKKDLTYFQPGNQPLLLEGGGRQSKYLLYNSSFLKYIEGIQSGMYFKYDSVSKKLIGVTVCNQSILQLYGIAFTKGKYNKYENYNFVDVDTNKFRNILVQPEPEEIDRWNAENLYTYEIIVPKSQSCRLYELMIKDLDRILGYRGSILSKITRCFVIKRLDGLMSSPNNHFGAHSFSIIELGSVQDLIDKIIENRSISSSNIPIIDESNYKGKLILQEIDDFNDLNFISSQLKKNGLTIVEEYRNLEIMRVE